MFSTFLGFISLSSLFKYLSFLLACVSPCGVDWSITCNLYLAILLYSSTVHCHDPSSIFERGAITNTLMSCFRLCAKMPAVATATAVLPAPVGNVKTWNILSCRRSYNCMATDRVEFAEKLIVIG